MRKKELLSMKPLPATRDMIRTAADMIRTEEDTYKNCYGAVCKYTRKKCKYRRYFRAAVEGDILKVAIFTKGRLIREQGTPLYEVFINRKENAYITYVPDTGKWRTAKINMLEYEDVCGIYTEEEWQTEGTRKLVNQYFETGKNLNVFQAVLDFQSEVKKEERQRKYRSEIEQIDATMKEVPELPKGFEEWVGKNCFQETMFYTKEKKYQWPRVYCTHCGKWMDAPGKPEHGKEVRCRSCGTKAVYRSWNKQKYVIDHTNVAVLQKLKDQSGYILRGFSARAERRHDKGWETVECRCNERVRARLSLDFIETELFEYGEYKNTGVNRWCHEIRHSGYGYYSCYRENFGYFQMYTPNLKRELRDQSFKNMDLKKIFKGGQKETVNPEYLLQILQRYPYLEYLQKSGMDNITSEIMNGKEIKHLFDHTGKKIHEVLKLDKQRFQRLRKWNGNCDVLWALQREWQTGEKLTDQNIRYIIAEKVKMSEVEELMHRTEMNQQRMLNYLERQQALTKMGYEEVRRYYRDYLDMAEARGMDLMDEIVCKQSRMMEFHNRYLEEKNKKENQERDADVDQRFSEIRENYEKHVKRFSFETKKYLIEIPKSASDITREGRSQHHCVGASDAYLKKMAEGKSFILFLRRKANPSVPYYTLEVDWNGKVFQWYGAYDRKPNKENIEKVLQAWTKVVKKRERELQKKQKTEAKEREWKNTGTDRQYPLMAAAI